MPELGYVAPRAVDIPRLLAPAGSIRESFRRGAGATITGQSVLTSGLAYLAAVVYEAGEVVTSITFRSGGTALVTGTHQWFGLADASGNKLAVSNNDTNAAWAASTNKTLTLSSSYTIPTTGIYYHVCMVAATTVPNLSGVAASTAVSMAPVLTGLDSAHTGLTDPASAPPQFTFSSSPSGWAWTYSS
jgi:hypothetical protein